MKNRSQAKKNFRSPARSWNRVPRSRRSVYLSYNLSDLEDSKNAFKIIGDLAARAGRNAAAEAKVAGLSRVYLRNNGDLVRLISTGEEVIISPRIKKDSFYVKYKPSTILHAVKK
jgi:hypothetical protein